MAKRIVNFPARVRTSIIHPSIHHCASFSSSARQQLLLLRTAKLGASPNDVEAKRSTGQAKATCHLTLMRTRGFESLLSRISFVTTCAKGRTELLRQALISKLPAALLLFLQPSSCCPTHPKVSQPRDPHHSYSFGPCYLSQFSCIAHQPTPVWLYRAFAIHRTHFTPKDKDSFPAALNGFTITRMTFRTREEYLAARYTLSNVYCFACICFWCFALSFICVCFLHLFRSAVDYQPEPFCQPAGFLDACFYKTMDTLDRFGVPPPLPGTRVA